MRLEAKTAAGGWFSAEGEGRASGGCSLVSMRYYATWSIAGGTEWNQRKDAKAQRRDYSLSSARGESEYGWPPVRGYDGPHHWSLASFGHPALLDLEISPGRRVNEIAVTDGCLVQTIFLVKQDLAILWPSLGALGRAGHDFNWIFASHPVRV